MLCLVALTGVTVAGTAPASAATEYAEQCAYGFCWNVRDWAGGRYVDLIINPGVYTDMCVSVASWNAGTPTIIHPHTQLYPNFGNELWPEVYPASNDATVHAYRCDNRDLRYFMFKVGAGDSTNVFI